MKTKALIVGIITIILWGSLATMGALLMHLPPFYMLGVAFLVGALPALSKPRELFPDWRVFLWGTLGLFGYHFFLFYSFRFAPAIEANLINYLWPVLIVILTPVFFPESQGLRWYHIAGAALAIIGSVFLTMGKGGEFKLEYLKGYLLAAGAAFTWPVYSLGRKKLPHTSVWAIGGFCLGASVLSFITHWRLEPWVVLQWHDAWKLIIMGLGPVGAAFYCWDYAIREGDTKVIGALAYLTPVLSTLGLLLFTDQALTSTTGIAMVLIISGASCGLLDLRSGKI